MATSPCGCASTGSRRHKASGEAALAPDCGSGRGPRRGAQDDLTRANSRLAEQQAVEQAANPVLMGLARSAAKDAIRQNLAIPLQVAGYGDVTVRVRFDGEPGPAG